MSEELNPKEELYINQLHSQVSHVRKIKTHKCEFKPYTTYVYHLEAATVTLADMLYPYEDEMFRKQQQHFYTILMKQIKVIPKVFFQERSLIPRAHYQENMFRCCVDLMRRCGFLPDPKRV